MREKVAKGLWGCEGERGEGKGRMQERVRGRQQDGGGTGGALCVREKVVIYVLVKRKEEPGRQLSVCICVYMHKELGFSSLLSPQAFPKNQGPKEPFNKM